MSREITMHHSGAQRATIQVRAVDDPNGMLVPSRYAIGGFDARNHPSAGMGTELFLDSRHQVSILFQKGDPVEVGTNGLTEEALLAVLVDRYRSRNIAEPHVHNEVVLKHLTLAMTAIATAPKPTSFTATELKRA